MSLSDQRRAELLGATAEFYHAMLLRSERIMAYLRGRKLADETIVEARLGYAEGGLKDHLLGSGYTLVEGQTAGLVRPDGKDFFYRKIVIPYVSQGQVVLLRARTDPEDPDKAYFPLPGYGVRLYNEDALAESTEVVITEGEFDCLILKQWGFAAVGLPGASVFKEEWITLFERCERPYLCLDTDAAGQKATRQAAELLGDKALIVPLPEGKDVTEYAGLGHTAEDFKHVVTVAKSATSLALESLPTLPTLEARVQAMSRVLERLVAQGPLMVAAYREPICQTMGWRKADYERAVKDMKRRRPTASQPTAQAQTPPKGGALAMLENAAQLTWVHPAVDFGEDMLWYGLPAGEQVLFVTSKRQLLRADELPPPLRVQDVGYALRRCSTEAIKRYLGGELVMGHGLIEQLSGFLTRFLFFRDPRIAVLVAVWTLGTYLHILFRYYGYLLLQSLAKRCGKSLLETILSHLAFNATPVFTHPTTAQLYRGPARDHGTQLLDELDRLKGNKELFGELLAVLNVGFQRGAVILRYERVGERFEERTYEAFAPRVLAGVATTSLPDVLEDRSIVIPMHRRRPSEPVERFNLRTLGPELQQLRDACYLWALTHAEALAQLYEQMSDVPALASLDDRLKDIWEPLLAIASLNDAERNDGSTQLVDVLIALAVEQSRLRAATEQESSATALIETLLQVRITAGEYLTPTQLLKDLQTKPGYDWLRSTRKLSQLLRPLGLIARSHRFAEKPDEPQRAYQLDRGLLEELRSRYGVGSSPAEEASVYTTQPPADQQVML